eukprot:13510791-Alexandrium_andersonii.AAC.1
MGPLARSVSHRAYTGIISKSAACSVYWRRRDALSNARTAMLVQQSFAICEVASRRKKNVETVSRARPHGGGRKHH